MSQVFLGIIPARSGSKGVKDKNIRMVAGKPLIAYTIEAAAQSALLTDCIVSTESERIAAVAKQCGGTVPFLRPAELATDDAPTIDVLMHAVAAYEQLHSLQVDYLVLLQPTTPLRTAADIDHAIALMRSMPEARSLITCYEATAIHPRIMYRRSGSVMHPYLADGQGVTSRHAFEPVYVRNGAIYIADRRLVVEERCVMADNPVGYLMPRERSVNIDDYFDLFIAESILRGGYGTSENPEC